MKATPAHAFAHQDLVGRNLFVMGTTYIHREQNTSAKVISLEGYPGHENKTDLINMLQEMCIATSTVKVTLTNLVKHFFSHNSKTLVYV